MARLGAWTRISLAFLGFLVIFTLAFGARLKHEWDHVSHLRDQAFRYFNNHCLNFEQIQDEGGQEECHERIHAMHTVVLFNVTQNFVYDLIGVTVGHGPVGLLIFVLLAFLVAAMYRLMRASDGWLKERTVDILPRSQGRARAFALSRPQG